MLNYKFVFLCLKWNLWGHAWQTTTVCFLGKVCQKIYLLKVFSLERNAVITDCIPVWNIIFWVLRFVARFLFGLSFISIFIVIVSFITFPLLFLAFSLLSIALSRFFRSVFRAFLVYWQSFYQRIQSWYLDLSLFPLIWCKYTRNGGSVTLNVNKNMILVKIMS